MLIYSSGSIVDSISQFNKLLVQTTYNSVLLQTFRLYVENEYIVAAMKALSYFTYKVTMPFFNCVEKFDHNGLTKILSALYEELSEGKLSTLSKC